MASMLSLSAAAQEGKRDGKSAEQRIEKQVTAMQKKLMLDDATAAKFAPLYKEYIAELRNCRPELAKGKNLSDEQIVANIEARMDAEQRMLDVQKRYFKKMSQILNAKQLQMVFSKKGFGDSVKHAKKFAAKPDKGKMKGDCKMGDCKDSKVRK